MIDSGSRLKRAMVRSERVMSQPPATDALIDARIAERYTVRALIRCKGEGRVYRARDEEHGRDVALHVLDADWAADPAMRDRFIAQARLASALAPNVIIDMSELVYLPDGRPSLVLPLIRGTDLATLLTEAGPIEPARVSSLLEQVATALDRIHGKGLVHHDLKPENLVRVTSERGVERLLVLGFGVQAVRFGRAPRLDVFDYDTPEFMPPEAASGMIPDARGDVYALATTAFELTTAALPFSGADVEELVRLKTTSEPSSLAQAAGRPFSEALEAVIARGLAMHPADRWASAGEFVRALSAAAAEVVPPRPRFRLQPLATCRPRR
jgi:serine/threonine protein kinase